MRSLGQPFGSVKQEACYAAVKSARTVKSSEATILVTVKFKESAYESVSVARTEQDITPLVHSVEMEGDLFFETTTDEGDAVGETYRIHDPRILRVPFEDPRSHIKAQARTETHPVLSQRRGFFSVRLPYHNGAKLLKLLNSSNQSAERSKTTITRLKLEPLE